MLFQEPKYSNPNLLNYILENCKKLLKLTTEEVDISEMALGRAMGTSKREMEIVYPKLPKRKRTETLDMSE